MGDIKERKVLAKSVPQILKTSILVYWI